MDNLQMIHTLSRREALKLTLATAVAAAVPIRMARAQEAATAASSSLAALTGTDWKPVFLTDDQARTVASMAETIIPRTDTPGALDARAHEFMDLILSIDNERNQGKFIEGVQWVDARSTTLYGVGFADASEAQRSELMGSISDVNKKVEAEVRDGWRFFKDVKRRTLDAYYSSREGLVEELGRPDGHLHRPYQGCRHGDGAHS